MTALWKQARLARSVVDVLLPLRESIVGFLIGHGCAVPLNKNITLLSMASASGNISLVKRVGNARLNTGLEFQDSIFQATYCGYIDVVKELGRHSSDITLLDKHRNSLLHVASMGGNKGLVKYFLSKHLAIDRRNRRGETPLMITTRKGHVQVFKVLLDHGADWNLTDDRGMNILHFAGFGGYLAMVKVVDTLGLDIDSRSSKGETTAMLAAKLGHMDILMYLDERGCNLTAADIFNKTVLHWACIGGDVDIVRFLRTRGVSPESRDRKGRTPFLMTAGRGTKEVLSVLVQFGCNYSDSEVDHNMYNALQANCLKFRTDVAAYLLSLGLTIDYRGRLGLSAAMVAARQGQKDMFLFLVHRGCDLTLRGSRGYNMLHHACKGCNVDIVRYILDNTTLGINSRTDTDKTGLMIALHSALVNSDVLTLLVSRGARTEDLDRRGRTVWSYARNNAVKEMFSEVVARKRYSSNKMT